MSIQSVLTTPRYPEQASAPTECSMRLQARQGDGDSCWSTALKVAAVIAGITASIGSFVFLGPIGGLVVTLLVGGAGALYFSNCCKSSAHDHAHDVAIPWYQRMFSYFPAGHSIGGNGPHVRVGGGHIDPAPAPRPWYQQWFPFYPSGPRRMDDNQPHVPVGRGHGNGGNGAGHVPRGGPGVPHVPVGRGHGPGGPGHGHGHPPVGPGIPHVPVGRGHGPGHGAPTSSSQQHVPVGHRHH